MTSTRVDEALTRLKGLFLEMPETVLTVEGACDLTRLDAGTCLTLLLALEQARFLCRPQQVISCSAPRPPGWTADDEIDAELANRWYGMVCREAAVTCVPGLRARLQSVRRR